MNNNVIMQKQEKFTALESLFVENVEKKRGGFEPYDNYDWLLVIAGYALANGFSHSEAYEFAIDLYKRGISTY